jgi:endogenous inhibitor of DNA gyrase (YacG/DUF329 family)
MPACPICKRPALPRARNEAFPFCGVRCKQVDLGNWLDEKYAIATSDAEGPGGSADGPKSDEENA